MNKTTVRQLFLGAALALFFTFTFVALAQETPPPAAKAPEEKPAAEQAAPAETPAVQPEPAAPAEATAAPAAPAEPAPLRRLDSEDRTDAGKSRGELIRDRVERARQRAAERRASAVGHDIVNVFGDSHLPRGEKADNVVAVFGSATSEGEVTEAIVSVMGSTRAEGPVGDAAVAVFGDNHVTSPVGDAAVAVLGNLSVNSHVRGDVVAVLGDVELGPEAVVDGQVVCVGGAVKRDPQAVLRHGIQNVGFGHSFHGFAGLKTWVRECLFYARPLAFDQNLWWAWGLAAAFLLLYVLLALLFRRSVEKCEQTLVMRPGYTVLAALLTVLIVPLATILLAMTGIGLIAVPFIAAGLLCATFFGKAVMLAWIGRVITRFFGNGSPVHPAFSVLAGGLIVLLLYTVPVLGFILYKLLGWIGLGAVVYTLVLNMRREKLPVVPPTPSFAPVPPVNPPAEPPPLATAMAGAGVGAVAGEPPPLVPPAPIPAAAVLPPPAITALLPRAGFWIRMLALLLDVILVAIVCRFLTGVFGQGSHVTIKADLLPVLAIYGAVMWKLKGTTIGGIVFGLKVVRLDDRPLDWGTAIVRALGCFLSLVVLGLGFLWIAFDDEKQSWHDKIAGTVVVCVPKGVSLL